MLERINNFKESTIAIIPARGGSSRIKNKNLKKIGKDSLIRNSLKTCKESGIFDQIILSTDSQEIAKEYTEYTSHNTERLSVLQIKKLLLSLDFIKEELKK